MERLTFISSFVKSRHRHLFQFPIYRKFGTGDRNAHTVFRKNNLVNCIHCRQKSSNIDRNIQYEPITRNKLQRFKQLKTNVTQVTETSSSQKQQPIQLVTRSNLPRFLNVSISPNVKPNQKDSQMIQLKQEPIVFIPDKFKMKLESNTKLLENFLASFETFIRLNPPNNVAAVPKPQEQTEPTVVPSQLPANDTKLQKHYNPITAHGFEHQASSFTHNMKCYVNACISSDMVERAFATLKSITRKNKFLKFERASTLTDLYCDIMAKYSSMRNWTRVNEIYDILVADKYSITPQIYMNILDCLGRMKDHTGNVKLIQNFVDKANAQGISMNDIMDKSKFMHDQREYVLCAIRRIQSSFTPNYTPPDLCYSNKLLETLNENVYSIDVGPEELMRLKEEFPISRPKRGFSASDLDKSTKEQIENEIEGNIAVRDITMLDEEQYVTDKVKFHRQILDQITNQWRVDIVNAIQRRMTILQHKMKTTSTKNINVYPYMCTLTPEQFTDILLDELKSIAHGCELYSPTVVQIYGQLGKKVMHKYQMKWRTQNGITKKIEHLHETYRNILCSGHCPDNPRQLWQRIVYHSRNNGPCLFQRDIVWPWPVRCEIGRTLFKILLENVKIDLNLLKQNTSHVNYVPVLYTLFRNREGVSREEVRPDPLFAQIVHEAKIDTMNFKTCEVPMLCPPIPWTSVDSGGYLYTHTDLLRLPQQFTYQNELFRATPTEQVYPVLDSINQLASVPWCVNTRVLDLVIKVFNLGGDKKLNVPLTPDSIVTDKHLKYRGIDRVEFENARNLKNDQYQKLQNELFSQYMDTKYKLSLANHFRDRPIWLPTNLDFRGRTYPVPPHLTHLSADLTRSMLCFHQKQPLGENGLDWLKLHCINLTGVKKQNSIQERLAYANDHIDDIIDSADNPLSGRQWWLNSDDPWQTLATCFEIVDAMRSPNPAEYMSGFPIHQDGSCNGLQHYAALGRDRDGAISVNLAPSKVPQDVYASIANRVEELRQLDAANGVKIAIELEGLIKRKIIKQTVMTTVYGVTAYGAKLQIKKQLKNIGFDSASMGYAASYLTKKTFESLSEKFKAAREIQIWLTKSAQYISSRNRSQHVEWTSPLGLPVIQPYIKDEEKLKANANVGMILPKMSTVNSIKQKNAFSPNFIHSLDSCHMMLTSLNCERAGITFVSVHDCFWTHPSTVASMNHICREQFILLHSQPILEDLAENFYQKYEIDFCKKLQKEETLHESNKTSKKTKKAKRSKKSTNIVSRDEHIFLKVPEKGDFDLNSVRDSTFFFS